VAASMMHSKVINVYNKALARYAIVSTEPLIFHVAQSIDQDKKLVSDLSILFEYLADQTAFFLYNWCWKTESDQKLKIIEAFEKDHAKTYPGHRFIHLCNTVKQTEIFRAYQLEAIFINQNCLVDEKIFRPIESSLKHYDAVYDACFKKFKRHELAVTLDSLALIYYAMPTTPSEFSDVEQIKAQFSHAHFFNHIPDEPDNPLKQTRSKSYQLLSPQEVNECLNRCKVGLCLSPVEGAMRASIQYLSAGLPIVSTPSEGGRDVFYDDAYVAIVEPNPEAVKQGVKALIARNIDPNLIRCQTLQKIQPHRDRLINLIQEIYDQTGTARTFAEEWDQIFFNKLIKLQNHLQVIEYLRGVTHVKTR
jgi:glycosyltransferase involved in cell wall biosynthesis